jgi:hypothetical protein
MLRIYIDEKNFNIYWGNIVMKIVCVFLSSIDLVKNEIYRKITIHVIGSSKSFPIKLLNSSVKKIILIQGS